MTNRIARKFDSLKTQGRTGLVTFMTCGDPDAATSQSILNALPSWGADFIELGMPFSDPMADGPAIQASSLRALQAGVTLDDVLAQAASFRASDAETPLILMGYYNPIYIYGTARFAEKARESGVDGLIIVDLPPEEDAELFEPARSVGLDIIRLVTPTTDPARLATILERTSGFIYYVSITGVTGTASADADRVATHLAQIRERTSLPIAVGFGISSPEDAAALGRCADAVVVGSALVRTIADRARSESDHATLAGQVRALAAVL